MVSMPAEDFPLETVLSVCGHFVVGETTNGELDDFARKMVGRSSPNKHPHVPFHAHNRSRVLDHIKKQIPQIEPMLAELARIQPSETNSINDFLERIKADFGRFARIVPVK